MVRSLCICFLSSFLFISCHRDVNRNAFSTYETSFDEALASIIDKTDTNTVEIVATSENEILQDKLQNIGYAIGPNKSSLQIILVKSIFGLRHSPHGNGKIYIVKNKKVIGYYNGLMYNFKAYLDNGRLMVQPEEDCPFTKIDFSKEIPSNIFLQEDSCGGGNEYPFCKEQTEP